MIPTEKKKKKKQPCISSIPKPNTVLCAPAAVDSGCMLCCTQVKTSQTGRLLKGTLPQQYGDQGHMGAVHALHLQPIDTQYPWFLLPSCSVTLEKRERFLGKTIFCGAATKRKGKRVPLNN